MFGKNRVEEDLARIRHANLPEKYPDPPPQHKRLARHETNPDERIGAKSIFAMIIAAFSIILPYAAALIAILGLVVLLITRFF